MRKLGELDHYRDSAWEAKLGRTSDDARINDKGGAFRFPSDTRAGVELRVIAGNGIGWDHISVSTSLKEVPTWAEMEQVKRLFFHDYEAAMQLHVPVKDHISFHDYTLHIWRPHSGIKLPPSMMVAY